VTGARHFKLGPDACAHDAVERCVLDRHPMCLPDPLAQRLIRGEAFPTMEGLLEAGEHGWCEGDGFACRHVGGQPCVQTSSGIDRQPAADGIAVDPQQARHILAGVGLPSGQEVEHLEAGLLMAVMFTLPSVFKIICMVNNRRYGCTHRLSSRRDSSLRSERITAICIIFNQNSYYTAEREQRLGSLTLEEIDAGIKRMKLKGEI
jgi:hypothetical protein